MVLVSANPEVAPAPGRIAVVVKGYPRLSETFIAQELLALEQRGLVLDIFSLRHPTDPDVHPVHRRIAARTTYLPEYLHQEPGRVLRAWRAARYLAGYAAARRVWLRDLRRDRSRSRVRRFGQACVLATELPAGTTRFYAHFLHTPASVARYAALMRYLPWSCSAHAKDIWTTPGWEKREKLADLDWLVTCTAVGRDHLADLAAEPDRVVLVYHGLDFSSLPPAPGPRPPRDGSDPKDPVTLLSVGRAVPKKGYGDLLQALGRLPPGLHWRLLHIGGGRLVNQLKAEAESLGLAPRITWLGAQPQEAVFERYREADLFVLACRIAEDGDRDGLPNVLMEAQSQALACVTSRVSAIPELIEDGETGLLVPPADPDSLAGAIARLIRDPARRAALGSAGAAQVRRCFSMTSGIDTLEARLAPTGRRRGAR